MSIMEMLGPAAVPTIIFLIVGLVMLIFEMFTPGVGIFGAAGLLSLIAVVVLQIGWGSPTIGILVIAIVLVIFILALLWFVRSFQKGRLSKSFLVLSERIDGSSAAAAPDGDDSYIGKTGVAVTALRPAGTAEIDGKRVNVATSGAFVEKGRQVRVLSLSGLDILVEEITE